MAGKREKNIPENTLSFLKLLSKERVPHVIVGGAALVLHGIPRSTLDIDIVIPAEKEAMQKLFVIAQRRGFNSRQAALLEISDRAELLIGQWITFCDADGRDIIDIFFETSKKFRELYRHSKKRRLGSSQLHIASLVDLEKMKKSSGRPIDLADIALIRERRKIK